ncbi:MAG: CvpA family protein [Xanthomonadales bacterium]|nr:MAG: CvpA family protein [Dokdonella sp.]MBC6943739.1 CvpA family protein [Xanthomonadales bacterium]MCC6596674.1 CvpA family protein [Rhodanobacteraceae bacterium]
MNWVDYAILTILGLSMLMGLWRGLIAEVLALAIWFCAFWVAWLFGPGLALRLEATIPTPSARIVLAWVLCFIAVLVAGALIAFVMRKLVAGSGLSGSDRLLGMVFGLVRGLALVVLVVFVLGALFRHDPWWRESRLLPTFQVGADWLVAHLPAEVARYLEPVENLLKQPVVPALPAPPTPPPAQ